MRRFYAVALAVTTLLACASVGWSDGSYTSGTAGKNALLVDGSSAQYSDITVSKTGDVTDKNDDYDWKGTNAAVLARGGAKLTITGNLTTITSDAAYGNAVFSYGGNLNGRNAGDGTTVTISDAIITTSKNNSCGLMTTGGGVMNATNLTVSTTGASSAAIRSDKGGGSVNVTGGTYTTSGAGSPAIYSTAAIAVSDATLKSSVAQGVVIEGGNSVTLNDCTVEASHTKLNGKDSSYQSVLIYQSQSGDAGEGTADFSMTGGKLTNARGDIFHVTNTTASVALKGVTITNNDSSGVFLSAAADNWGTEGSNGGKVTLTASGQTLAGDMTVDSVSTLDLRLKDKSTFTGAITDSSSSSSAAGSRSVIVTVDEGSTWTLTGDSSITTLVNNGTVNQGSYALNISSGPSSGNGTINKNGGTASTSSSHGGGCDTLRGAGAGFGALALIAVSFFLPRKKGV